MEEGLRARKKRETRQRISDIATGLFLERGFVTVTVADVARAADVSVNTVYNYFPSKEDLCLDRGEAQRQRLVRLLSERRPGESAARAVLRGLREEIENRDPTLGLSGHFAHFMRMVLASDSLSLRMHTIGREMAEAFAAALHEELGTGPEDVRTDLVASQIAWAQRDVLGEIGRRVLAEEPVDEIVRSALDRLDVLESLLSDEVLEYAVRKG
ncbi:TetR/AcrR family transcriptional regulator [Phaeacidiphilus oryzae]|jgi:AcrR family transcriptional regulator|uniref:TetR/AcrR family transcriptional regulator n=1 Tax=Phaeacidiphilus oryzae TaxID=348818 RepID=UPI0005632E2F|nr:TetR/AcrR family transcriptional regulator [Phaeacidiphilus oryzae]